MEMLGPLAVFTLLVVFVGRRARRGRRRGRDAGVGEVAGDYIAGHWGLRRAERSIGWSEGRRPRRSRSDLRYINRLP